MIAVRFASALTTVKNVGTHPVSEPSGTPVTNVGLVMDILQYTLRNRLQRTHIIAIGWLYSLSPRSKSSRNWVVMRMRSSLERRNCVSISSKTRRPTSGAGAYIADVLLMAGELAGTRAEREEMKARVVPRELDAPSRRSTPYDILPQSRAPNGDRLPCLLRQSVPANVLIGPVFPAWQWLASGNIVLVVVCFARAGEAQAPTVKDPAADPELTLAGSGPANAQIFHVFYPDSAMRWRRNPVTGSPSTTPGMMRKLLSKPSSRLGSKYAVFTSV